MTTPAPHPRLLVVEDEAIVALDLKLQLEDLGYTVVGIAGSGDEALRLARAHRPDLVLMDVHLKGPMDGVQAAAALGRETDAPVIYLTAHGDADTVQRAAGTGAYGYLTKPFDVRELRAGIEVALARADADRQRAELAAQRLKVEAAELAARAKNEFLSRMSHELRTPLNAVLGFAQLLALPGNDEATVAAYAGHILQSGQHLLSLVDDVLDLQRVASGGPPPVLSALPLAEQVQRVLATLAPLAAPAGIVLEQAIAPGLRVRADALRLRQVLLNIGSNAVKYNRPGGRVRCRAELMPGTPGRVQLHVDDTGSGIAPEAMARLFQPFERLGQERSAIPGTGLGLMISRALMEDMGGRLELSSTPGAGTSVCLEFAQA